MEEGWYANIWDISCFRGRSWDWALSVGSLNVAEKRRMFYVSAQSDGEYKSFECSRQYYN